MVLLGVKKDDGWLLSSWNLTYRVGWRHICKGVNSVYDFYNKPEVLVNGKTIEVSDKSEVLDADERGNMTIRGFSKIINAPIMITFYNQTQRVDVTVPCVTDEFKEADYQKFNKSLCQYLDSIELAMYR